MKKSIPVFTIHIRHLCFSMLINSSVTRWFIAIVRGLVRSLRFPGTRGVTFFDNIFIAFLGRSKKRSFIKLSNIPGDRAPLDPPLTRPLLRTYPSKRSHPCKWAWSTLQGPVSYYQLYLTYRPGLYGIQILTKIHYYRQTSLVEYLLSAGKIFQMIELFQIIFLVMPNSLWNVDGLWWLVNFF